MDTTLDIPEPQDILTVLDSFDAHKPPALPADEWPQHPYDVILRAGYMEVRKILLYAYYCSLRDSYEQQS